MGKLILLALLGVTCHATTLAVLGVTQTQAILVEYSPATTCTVVVSTDPTFTSPTTIPDFVGSQATDTLRADTITGSDGTRTVIVGHMNGNLALQEETTYYVNSCGASTSFTTTTVSNGTNTTWPYPFNPSNWDNRDCGYTLSNVTDPKGTAYIDCLTGIKLTAVNGANDFTSRYPDAGHNPVGSCITNGDCEQFLYFGGGTNWSNVPSAGSPFPYTGSTVSVGSTGGSLDVYAGTGYAGVHGPLWTYFVMTNDLAAVLYDGCSSGGGCNYQICLILNQASGCVGTPISITAPVAALAHHSSASTTDPDYPYPASFPSALFSGWGSGAMIGIENQPTASNCTLSASSGVLTVDSAFVGGSPCAFQQPILSVAGTKIYVAGSSPTCTVNLCTANPQTGDNAYSLHISESLTIATGTSYVALGWGIRITPSVTSGSTLTLGIAYKQAGTQQPAQTTAGPNIYFNPLTFTTSTGTQAHLAQIFGNATGSSAFWSIDNKGTVLPLFFGKTPSSSYFTGLGFASGDIPQTCCNLSWSIAPSTDAYSWYLWMSTQASGSYELYKLTYKGNASEGLIPFAYTIDPNNDVIWSSRALTSANCASPYYNADCFGWTALTPGANFISAVQSMCPNYNTSLYPGSAWQLAAASGTAVYLQNIPSQDNTPGWIAILDASSGTSTSVTNCIWTLDGTGTNGKLKFGALHNVGGLNVAPLPIVRVTDDPLHTNNSAHIYGGPYEMTVLGLSRGGTFNANTALGWPITCAGTTCTDNNSQTYDAACPSGNAWTYMGAVNNQCFQIKVAGCAWFNLAPNSGETLNCTYSSTGYSTLAISPGDVWFDYSGTGGDGEQFRVIAVDTVSASPAIVVTGQRNAIWDYCSKEDPVNHPEGTNGYPFGIIFGSDSQFRHTNGWQPAAVGANLNGCDGTLAFISGLYQSGQQFGYMGHTFGIAHQGVMQGSGTNIQAFNFDSTIPSAPFASFLPVAPPPPMYSIAQPTFAGVSTNIASNGIQSYDSEVNGQPWYTDSNLLFQSGPSRTVTHVSGNIYLVQIVGFNSSCTPTPSCWYIQVKNFPAVAWVGGKNTLNVSGPASTSVSALAGTPYSICLPYVNGECYAGSVVSTTLGAGFAYANVPNEWDNGYCNAAMLWANSPCVVMIPGYGAYRQRALIPLDQQGTGSRFLTYGGCPPGTGTGYYAQMVAISAQQAFVPPCYATQWGNTAFIVQLPTWTLDTNNRTVGGGITVSVPSGYAYARVHFGYSRFGLPGSFYCSVRSEACNTSTNSSPYSFDSETGTTSTSCSAGCTITIPAMAPNLVYWQVQVSPDGTTWTNWGDIIPAAVP